MSFKHPPKTSATQIQRPSKALESCFSSFLNHTTPDTSWAVAKTFGASIQHEL